MLRAYKYCILPTTEQKQKLNKFFGCCRFVYNLGLETKIRAWSSANRHISGVSLINQMKELKDTEAKWLHDCPSQSLQMTLRNLDNAFKRFYDGQGFPKFKTKHNKQTIQFPQKVKVCFRNGVILIPKLGNIVCVFHRLFNGKIKTATISKTVTDKYFISIIVDNQNGLPNKKSISEESTIGIDLGIKTFAVLSNGTVFENPKYLRKNLHRLRIEQRKLSRRFKIDCHEQSKSYSKQRLVVAKLHEQIRNQRTDYLHKASTQIIKSFDTICLENLNIRGMIGNNNLALSISEIGWAKFKSFLEYKAEWYGKNIISIGRFEPTSKTCSNCGIVFKELKINNRVWTCKNCGINHDRDINAAVNIKKFGLRDQPATVNVSQKAVRMGCEVS